MIISIIKQLLCLSTILFSLQLQLLQTVLTKFVIGPSLYYLFELELSVAESRI